ncbi:hypothetical protein HDF24_24015 [Mucilaginibacter sp. X4EP1]|uniref:hypothetical protein n=1 Tax=Mucilaginibacter sp. X4EP1 TaxID=2723092 RepID=UPI002167C351|nr:hypothetical protein [Mucilaginibacter sp. X4EP1]MCS3816159.1 hypothetical protein [Mucilaginibacter sp. X4EP1]
MKAIYCLAIALFICLLYSCGKSNSTPSQQSLLLGKWILQQEHMVASVNGVTQTDTTINASAANRGDVNFGKSGTFTSSGYYNTLTTGGILSAPPEVASDSTSGVYSFASNQFSMNVPIAGFIILGGAGFATSTNGSGTPPVYSLASHAVKISQLSQSVLTLQTDYLYSETSPAAGTYEIATVFNFTR